MSRKHRGLGRGLDALIPKRVEIEKEFSGAAASSTEVFFSDEEDSEDVPSVIEQTEAPARSTGEKEAAKQEEEKKAVRQEEEKKAAGQEEGNSTAKPVEEQKTAEPERAAPESEKQGKGKEAGEEGVRTVRISQIEPNRGQPRRSFEEQGLEELADSIRQYGIIQPILVQEKGDHFEIIAGERRWRAAMKAGINEVPVIVRTDDDRAVLEVSLIENIQRQDLNPVEEAQAYRELMDKYGLTQEEVAERVSKSRSAVANTLRLLNLDERVQQMLTEGKISMGHARALLSLENKEEQYLTAAEVEKKQLSVRETEKLVKLLLKNKEKPGKERRKESGDTDLQIIYRDLEERLCQKLGTKVSISSGKNGSGKLQIAFYSYEDLEKVIDKLS